MAPCIFRAVVAGLTVLLSVSSAHAYWLRNGCHGGGPAAYYPVPVCPVPNTPVISMPSGPGPIQVRPVPRDPLAVPSPAPPSMNEPPLGSPPKRAPLVTESKWQAQQPALTDSAAKDRLLVGFWNLSGRDVTLKVDGQSRVIGKDKAITLQVERQFVWQVDQGEPKMERVPPERRQFEVLIR